MTNIKVYKLKNIAVLALWLVSLFLLPQNTRAAELTNRSVTITNPKAGEVTDHLFSFEFQNNITIGSVAFEYCNNAALLNSPCTPPPGLDIEQADLDFQSGITGFVEHPNTTANRYVISRAPSNDGPGIAQYLLGGFQNHSVSNDTVYVRIYAYASDDGTGAHTDAGAVAYATTESLTVGGYVPPFLIFCVGVTVELDCTSSEGNLIDLGELQPNLTSVATSQYAGATNDGSGYTVAIYGTTLTSGNNVIPALTTPQGSLTGVSQFGINLRDNSSPDVGTNVLGPGSSNPTAGYNLVDNFKYTPGEIISQSPTSTNFDRMTVSYMVNVSEDQAPGIYNSTFTYIAVATF